MRHSILVCYYIRTRTSCCNHQRIHRYTIHRAILPLRHVATYRTVSDTSRVHKCLLSRPLCKMTTHKQAILKVLLLLFINRLSSMQQQRQHPEHTMQRRKSISTFQSGVFPFFSSWKRHAVISTFKEPKRLALLSEIYSIILFNHSSTD